MSLKLHPLKVSKVVKLTSDAAAIYFDIPEHLRNIFNYVHGQFISLQVNVNGQNYRREYSLCTSPYYEKDFVIASKKIGKGIVSNYLYDNLKAGDTIEVFPPNGKFYTELNAGNEKYYFLIGGGSGITPLMSILKSVLYKEPKSKIVLYYGNASGESIMFKDELIELKNKYSDRFRLYFTVAEPSEDWNDLKGIINKNDLLKIIDENVKDKGKEAEYFICGPEEMMRTVKNDLTEMNTDQKKIHIEYFTAPVQHEEYTPEVEELDETKEREVKIILDGGVYKVTVPPEIGILDAAINADLDPPFSCKSGICTTCRAKLYSGKVKMDEREGLSDAEIEEGYILTCQSHPLTDNVELEYM